MRLARGRIGDVASVMYVDLLSLEQLGHENPVERASKHLWIPTIHSLSGAKCWGSVVQSITQQSSDKDTGWIRTNLDATAFHLAKSSETDNTIVFVSPFVSLMCDIRLRWRRKSAGAASSSVIRRRMPSGRLNGANISGRLESHVNWNLRLVFAINGSTKQVMSEIWEFRYDRPTPLRHFNLLLELAKQLAAILAGVAFPPLPIYSHVFRVRLSILGAHQWGPKNQQSHKGEHFLYLFYRSLDSWKWFRADFTVQMASRGCQGYFHCISTNNLHY